MEEFGDFSIYVWALKSDLITGGGQINTHIKKIPPVVEVPLMADGTLSLKILQKVFKGAECLFCNIKGDKSAEFFSMLKMKGDQIFPPEGGWKYSADHQLGPKRRAYYFVCSDLGLIKSKSMIS